MPVMMPLSETREDVCLGKYSGPTPQPRPLPNTPMAPDPRELPWPVRQLSTAALGRRGQKRV